MHIISWNISFIVNVFMTSLYNIIINLSSIIQSSFNLAKISFFAPEEWLNTTLTFSVKINGHLKLVH